ncbi:MAG TPA: hypothetical protein VGM30_11400 [Puia sp.]
MPSYNNTWADKLEEIPVPDPAEGWQAMEKLLEEEMPSAFPKRTRRSWFLFFLLLLLIAVFYFYRTLTPSAPSHSSALQKKDSPVPEQSDKGGGIQRDGADEKDKQGTGTEGKGRIGAEEEGRDGREGRGEGQNKGHLHHGREAVPVYSRGSTPSPGNLRVASSSRASVHHPMASGFTARPASGRAVSGAVPGAGAVRGSGVVPGSDMVPGSRNTVPAARRFLHRSEPGGIQSIDRSVGRITARTPLLVANADSASGTKKGKDRSKKRSEGKGWEFGIGFNQSIATGQQQRWTNQSGGFNQPLKDYIPVPSVRYHLNSRLYLQAEARIHAPQYTRKDLEFLYVIPDSPFQARLLGPIPIKKLFYFQLPVSIHYSPVHNWSVGLGLQYSRFNSGITYNADTAGNRAEPIKDYPDVHIRSFEFRGLASVDYSIKKWTLGASYDLSLTRFVNYQLNGPYVYAPAVQGRNHSLQLYLRYYFWDTRKKKKPVSLTK